MLVKAFIMNVTKGEIIPIDTEKKGYLFFSFILCDREREVVFALSRTPYSSCIRWCMWMFDYEETLLQCSFETNFE